MTWTTIHFESFALGYYIDLRCRYRHGCLPPSCEWARLQRPSRQQCVSRPDNVHFYYHKTPSPRPLYTYKNNAHRTTLKKKHLSKILTNSHLEANRVFALATEAPKDEEKISFRTAKGAEWQCDKCQLARRKACFRKPKDHLSPLRNSKRPFQCCAKAPAIASERFYGEHFICYRFLLFVKLNALFSPFGPQRTTLRS